MPDLLGLSVTGLKVAQSALSTTGHNIANAGTDGYSRQRVQPVTNPAIYQGTGFIGSGANVNSIERIANRFVTEQLRIDSTLNSDLETYSLQVSQLDNLLSDDATGLTGALQSFFAAMQNGADDPTSIPARQLIVSQAENLADRFNSIDSRMNVFEEGIRDGLEVAVSQANALINSVAELNQRISDAKGLTGNAQPNDLLDQRDETLRQLSELLPIQVIEQGQNQVNVIVASGQSLIVGDDVKTIALEPSTTSGSVDAIKLKSETDTRDITNAITGGELGALIRYREDVLFPAYNSFGRVAIAVGEELNRLHQKGVTLENEYGGNFFNDINDETAAVIRVQGSSNNAPPADREMSLFVRDIAELTESNYQVKIEREGLYTIERLSDGKEVATGLFPGGFPFSVEFDGLELEFSAGSFSQGDEFLLQPTRSAASLFSRNITNPEDIAFGSPILSDADIGNTGSGKISAGEVVSLTAPNGTALPILANPGQMAPPLIIQFTSSTTYDVLDNSDPARPQQLEPPLRNQTFIPGISNPVFTGKPGQTQVTSQGEMVGLPEGRRPITQAAVVPGPVNPINAISGLSQPEFAVTDFSGAEQFSFTVDVTGTLGGVNDSSATITISSANIADEQSLIEHINNQLGPSEAEAYIAISPTGQRSIAFALEGAGYGNITVGGYVGPGTGNADALLNISIEGGASYTSIGNANGVEGVGTLDNNYPAEQISLTVAPEQAGLPPQVYNVFASLHGSARELASQLTNVPGVEANAFSYAEVEQFNFENTEPAQITLNGFDLIKYDQNNLEQAPVLSETVPNPLTHPGDFNQYIAQRINEHPDFQSQGIYAVAAQDDITGNIELRVYSSQGDDLSFEFEGQPNESISISDGDSSAVTLDGAGNHTRSRIVVGGRLDVRMDEGITLSSRPSNSLLFGDTQAANFAMDTYMGIAVDLNGVPETGDRFTLDFNQDASSDNRNALDMVDVEQARVLNGGTARVIDAYGELVETAGIESNTARINSEAARAVLDQTQTLRDSVSGVNLDEEASNLIRFEQFYQANAQVISVARNLFDTLIGSF